MPPNTFTEWMIGQNVLNRKSRRPSQREVVKIELSTDDESKENTIAVTVPRNGASIQNRQISSGNGGKRVRFLEEAAPKSALRSNHLTMVPRTNIESSSSDTFVNSSYEGDSQLSDEELITDLLAGRRPRSARKLLKAQKCLNETNSSDDFDLRPHSDCSCYRCKAGRRALRLARRLRSESLEEESQSDSEEETVRRKKKDTGKKKDKRPAKSSDDDESDNSTKSKKGKWKKNGKKVQRKEADTDSSEDEQSDDENAKKTKASKGKKKNAKTDWKDDATQTKGSKDNAKKNSSKKSWKSSGIPPGIPAADLRRPNLLFPTKAQVLQVEHTVETPDDPRPNAFLDNDHGVVRVYHGPSYGNPFGALYPSRAWMGRPPPMGMPHPANNPYFNGFNGVDSPYGTGFPPQAPPNPPFPGPGTAAPPPQTAPAPAPAPQAQVQAQAQNPIQIQPMATTLPNGQVLMTEPINPDLAAQVAGPTSGLTGLARLGFYGPDGDPRHYLGKTRHHSPIRTRKSSKPVSGGDKDQGWENNVDPVGWGSPPKSQTNCGSHQSNKSRRNDRWDNSPPKDGGVWDDSPSKNGGGWDNSPPKNGGGWDNSPPKNGGGWDNAGDNDTSGPSHSRHGHRSQRSKRQNLWGGDGNDSVKIGDEAPPQNGSNRGSNNSGSNNSNGDANGGANGNNFTNSRDAWGHPMPGSWDTPIPVKRNGNGNRGREKARKERKPDSGWGDFTGPGSGREHETGGFYDDKKEDDSWPWAKDKANDDRQDDAANSPRDDDNNDTNNAADPWEVRASPSPAWCDPTLAQSTKGRAENW